MKHQKQRNIIILLVVAALLVVSAFYIYPPGKKTHLGLELQGGLEIVYKAELPNGTAPTHDQLTQTVGIIDRRVNGLGVTEAAIQLQGTDQISVALPGVKNVDQAVRTVGPRWMKYPTMASPAIATTIPSRTSRPRRASTSSASVRESAARIASRVSSG